MARRRTLYDVDTRTKILDTHTQFRGGLKTVDTDDSVKDFFLRDVENISLSEFGFLERRYGLVNDYNFEFLVEVDNDFNLPNGETIYKDRLQGYFEYVRKDGVREQIVFYNGRLYLNGVQIRQLYKYPTKFDPILGNYNNNITENQFIEYLARVHNYTDFETFDSIDDLFNTGREVEGVRIDDRMFFFTGIYPIVYEGTGEFWLLPEYVTNFEQLALFSHNLHTADLNTTYAAGFEATPITIDASELTRPYFSELGYAPMYPYMVGTGRGFTIRSNYKMPAIAPYTSSPFVGFYQSDGQIRSGANYLELVPEVYYRPSGLSSDDLDETWTRVEQANVEYTVLSNLSTDEAVRTDPRTFLTDLQDQTVPSFLDPVRSTKSQPLYTSTEKAFNITVQNLPSGLYDILIDYTIYSCVFESVDNVNVVVEKPDLVRTEIIRNITFTQEKTSDYVTIQTDDEGNEIPTPVYDPAALWTCNRVLNHYGKLMAYGSLIHPERVFIGHPTYVHYFPWFFTRDFENDAQEPLQQITPFMNILVVQSETYTWGLKGIDAVLGAPNFYTPFVISPIYGTIAPKSVRPVRNQLFFLSQDGIVSIQSLYAIDEQYNVKHIDKNIENIVPLDPEAVAIQYDNQYWINFPNTTNNMTLRYHVDLKAWMKDTYFDYNGIDENGNPQKSDTIFNGVYKYIREDDKLVIITNPMRLAKNLSFVDDNENYKILRLYVDYSIATDVKEVPRALFETSFLDQDYPFNEKKYLEEKMQFTIQNEYHLGKEPIFRDESMTMIPNLGNDAFGNPIHLYTLYDLPLNKNHDYEIIVPNIGAPVYENSQANIKRITVRLFDIQGNLIDTLEYRENTAPVPSIKNFRVFPSNNTVQFEAYNNDIVPNDIHYALNNQEQQGILFSIPAMSSRSFTLSLVQFGPNKLELFAKRPIGGEPEFSDHRVLYFQMPDGVYDEFTFTPVIPSLPPIQLSAVAEHVSTTVPVPNEDPRKLADRFVVTWQDQNPGSEKFRYTVRQVGFPVFEDREIQDTTFIIDFTEQQAIDLEGAQFDITVEAYYENQWSPQATLRITLEYFDELPGTITDLDSLTLFQAGQILFSWTDVQFESGYQLYYKFVNDIFATLDDYPANQKKILSQNSDEYRFDATGGSVEFPRIPQNSIIEVLVRPFNQNGTSANDAVYQGFYQQNYPIDAATNPIEVLPLNTQSGVRVTIPEALKQTATSQGYVFEHQWEVQIAPSGSFTFGSSIFKNTDNNKNYFELTAADGLQANTEYNLRFRPRYIVNGTLQTPFPFDTDLYLTVTTGTAEIVPTTAPSLSAISLSTGSNSNSGTISFSITNNHSPSATLYYLISTSSSATVSDTNFTGQFTGVSSGQIRSVSNFAVSDGQTYYIKAVAKYDDLPLSSVASGQITIPNFIVADFDSNGGTPTYSSQGGYSPLTVTNPGSVSKSGSTFNGWTLGGSFTSFPRQISSNSIFIASFTQTAPTTISVTFNLNGGSGTYNTITGTPPLTIQEPVEPTKAGNTFEHWVWSGTGSPASFPLTTSENGSLTAIWEPIPGGTPPLAPSSISVSSFADTVGVNFTDNSTDETGFTIQITTGSNYSGLVRSYDPGAFTGTGTQSFSQATGLASGTYYLRMRSYNSYGESAWVNYGAFTISTFG